MINLLLLFFVATSLVELEYVIVATAPYFEHTSPLTYLLWCQCQFCIILGIYNFALALLLKVKVATGSTSVKIELCYTTATHQMRVFPHKVKISKLVRHRVVNLVQAVLCLRGFLRLWKNNRIGYSIVKDSNADLGVIFKFLQNSPITKAVCTKISKKNFAFLAKFWYFWGKIKRRHFWYFEYLS